MQGGTRDDDTANIDRFEHRPGVNGSRPANIDADVEEFGGYLDRWIFEGDGPARIAAYSAQFFLVCQIVYFDHHTINFVGQVETFLLPLTTVLEHILKAVSQMDMRVDRKTPGFDQL